MDRQTTHRKSAHPKTVHKRTRNLDGESYEARSARLLEHYGLTIIARRFRCRRGEIDLIAADEHSLLFVEVRARRSLRYGGAVASVDARKRCKIARCAGLFLQKHPQWRHLPCRFDVIAWEPSSAKATDEPLQARWIQAAFIA